MSRRAKHRTLPEKPVESPVEAVAESPVEEISVVLPVDAAPRAVDVDRVCWVVNCLEPAEVEAPFCPTHMDDSGLESRPLEEAKLDREWVRKVRLLSASMSVDEG